MAVKKKVTAKKPAKAAIKTIADIVVKSDLLRAAQQCQAKQDVRFYLNGTCLTSSGLVLGTNGHLLFSANGGFKMSADHILWIDGIVPNGMDATFEPLNETEGIVRLNCPHNKKDPKVMYYKTIDGKFPDARKILPKNPVEATTSISLQAKYVAMVSKVFGGLACVKISSYGDDKQHPVKIECVRDTGGKRSLASADAVLIIMQIRC